MFRNARLKLTAWYLLIAILVSAAFSLAIYRAQTTELESFVTVQRSRIEFRLRFLPPSERERFMPQILEPQAVQNSENHLALSLIIINGILLLISGGLGYFLAGKTLQPIKLMVEDQNHFISDASHELRTPLAALKTALEVAQRDKNATPKDFKNLISDSLSQVNKLQSLSNGLLELTQTQKPNGQHQFEILSLSLIVAEAVRQILPLAKQKQITVRNETAELNLKGNKPALVNLLTILLDNAVKYSPSKTRITIKSQKTDASAVIQVIDQGIGISPKDLPHIFNRFFRADFARTKSDQGGYGLGLAIAQKIVLAHHGSLTVESQLGHGSTFTVRLPQSQS